MLYKCNIFFNSLNNVKGTCLSTEFWDSVNLKCVVKYDEKDQCTADYQCKTPMSCDLASGCLCDYTYYWSTTANTCNPQGKNGNSCPSDIGCRGDLGILKQNHLEISRILILIFYIKD